MYGFRRPVSQGFCRAIVGAVVLWSLLSRSYNEVLAQTPEVLRAWQQTLHQAIDKAEPSVVSIARIRRGRPQPVEPEFDPFGRMRPDRNRRHDPAHPEFIPNSFGTGVIFAPQHDPRQRLILTMYHVVRGGKVRGRAGVGKDRLYVQFHDRTGCDAVIVAADPRSDFAVLELQAEGTRVSPAELQPITWARDPEARKGDLVLIMGNPYAIARDGSASVCQGFVSNVSRRPAPLAENATEKERMAETIHHFGTLLQLDARLNLGTSGGAVLNLQGEMIGITTSLAALEGVERGVGFAVPLNAGMQRVINDLSQGYEVEYGMLGVEPRTIAGTELARVARNLRQPSAAEILKVIPSSPAAKAGLRHRDVILSVGQVTVYSHYDLMREIGELAPLQKARVRVLRPIFNSGNHQELQLEVVLGKKPVPSWEDLIITRHRYGPYDLGSHRGLLVDFPTARREFFVTGAEYQPAVVITNVESTDLNASQLQAGDYIYRVNGKAVSTPEEFNAVLQPLLDRAAGGEPQNVTFTLGGNRTETLRVTGR